MSVNFKVYYQNKTLHEYFLGHSYMFDAAEMLNPYKVLHRYSHNIFNPLLHRYSFLRLLQQTAFENIVTKAEIVPSGLKKL